eukprot:443095-Rhodomonas_salina.2
MLEYSLASARSVPALSGSTEARTLITLKHGAHRCFRKSPMRDRGGIEGLETFWPAKHTSTSIRET